MIKIWIYALQLPHTIFKQLNICNMFKILMRWHEVWNSINIIKFVNIFRRLTFCNVLVDIGFEAELILYYNNIDFIYDLLFAKRMSGNLYIAHKLCQT